MAYDGPIPFPVKAGGTGSTNIAGITVTNGIMKYDGTVLTTSATAKIDSSNRQTNTSQPAFLTYLNSSAANVTGDGTVYQVAFDTIVFDQGSNFTTGASAQFTAPVTGRYFFSVTLNWSIGVVGTNSFFLDLVATSRTLRSLFTPSTGINSGLTATGILDMTATNTLKVNFTASNGTKSTQVNGSASPHVTYLSGYLVA